MIWVLQYVFAIAVDAVVAVVFDGAVLVVVNNDSLLCRCH